MTSQIARTAFEQLGGHGLHGAINLTGGRDVVFHPDDLSLPAVEPDDHGWMTLVNRLQWRPNVNARGVKFIVALQADDTYSVYLYKTFTAKSVSKTGCVGTVLAKADCVYCDQLVDLIDALYIAYVRKHQQGFIRI